MNPTKSTIKVDRKSEKSAYNPMIFGGFLEHFDNQIYGGVFDPGSPLADESGFRLDVIEALKELKVPIIRWPGGCFVDAYRWRNGVGNARKPYGGPRWGVIEQNNFGTHEFVELCRRIEAEPYICFNSLADVRENLDWVAYCNSTFGPLAEMRRANGHPEPFDVKYWSVGNERYDREYVKRVRDTAKAMKQEFPDLLITCSGAQGEDDAGVPGVQSYLLETAGNYLDYVSIHNYWLPRGDKLPSHGYMKAILKSEKPEADIQRVIDSLEKNGCDNLKIAFDEWNLRAWQHPGFPRDQVDDFDSAEIKSLVKQRRMQNDLNSQYTIVDALFIASFLNSCLRHGDKVAMANIAPLVNTRGPLFVHPEGIVRRSSFHALAMYANLLQTRIVKTEIDSDELSSGDESCAVMDAIATITEQGEQLTIALLNRHPVETVSTDILVDGVPVNGNIIGTMLSAETIHTYNSIEHPERIKPVRTELVSIGGSYQMPPHSLIFIEIIL